MSARHLRRLFETYVGATPGVVARSRRAHLARRLLDETDLSISDVGFAAGFASVRQMNRVMKEVFRFTPSELRARRRRADRLVADGGLDLRLPYNPPLAWEALTGFLGARAIPGIESLEGGIYRRTVRIDGHAGVIELSHLEAENSLKLRVHLPSYGGLAHIVAGARRIFDLDADPKVIYKHLSRDLRLRPLLKRMPGVRVPGTWDRFELAVRAVLGQQITVRGARTLAGRLVQNFGEPIEGLNDMRLNALFPTAERIANASQRRLQSIGLPQTRAATIRRLAASIEDGSVQLNAGQSLNKLVEELSSIPGVGPWTAHYIAMRACGQPDAFPAGDLGLRRALADNGEVPTPAEVTEHSKSWRPWRAYATTTLWLAPSN